MWQTLTLICAGLVWGIGLFGLFIHRDLIKLCVALSIMETALIIVLVALAYVPGAAAPILDGSGGPYVNPLPHALALTAIVIGAGILAVALALTVLLYRHYGTTNLTDIFGQER